MFQKPKKDMLSTKRSLVFKKVFKTLTGRKLVTEYLSSVCLSKGLKDVISRSSGNIPLLKLLLITVANGLLKIFTDGFTILAKFYSYM